MARWLESKSNVTRVFYPGLMSHPQYELAKCQQKSGGGIVTFEVKGGKEAAWRVIDSTRLISITANLGDAKSTLTHPQRQPMLVSVKKHGMPRVYPMDCYASQWG